MVNAIRRMAAEKGISIRELEKQSGISPGAIYRWDVNRPSIDNAKKVADVLDTSIDELMREEGEDDA